LLAFAFERGPLVRIRSARCFGVYASGDAVRDTM
jgi:hypothetical protein